MRKKSHISLAKYIVSDMEIPVMTVHRKAFYFGNILPDLKPSFVTVRHEFYGTFDIVEEGICELSLNADMLLGNARAYMRHLGEVTHYVADYFTYPHNKKIYPGTMREHCKYEKELKKRLRRYIGNGEAYSDSFDAGKFDTPESICMFIRSAHEEYERMRHGVEEDCEFIVRVCYQVVQAVLNLINVSMGADMAKRLCLAA